MIDEKIAKYDDRRMNDYSAIQDRKRDLWFNLIFGLVVGCFVGFCTGALVVRHSADRYTLTKVGPTVMRTDTRTGQSWLFAGFEWKPIPETTARALTTPVTFIPDSQPVPHRTVESVRMAVGGGRLLTDEEVSSNLDELMSQVRTARQSSPTGP